MLIDENFAGRISGETVERTTEAITLSKGLQKPG
jgi:hypothetical protein